MADVALAATQTIPFAIGALLAERYELRALLGEGAMGVVFRAHDRELDENVALKVLNLEAAEDTATLLRFRREVKLARRVTHRNVARTFDLGLHRDQRCARFLTMELIEGTSLGTHARSGAVHLPEALRITAEIARGLAAAHVVGVVHRDLKPENIMVTGERVVITDFGIARVADGVPADVMRTGMIVGTPAYMAPEQLENGAIDGRTDVYALGTILFELLASRLPFMGDTAMSIAAQRLTTDAPDVRTLERSVPDGVAALVHDMLARRREDRPDAQAVIDRVEALRGNAAGVVRAGLRAALLTNDSIATLGQPRVVVVEPLAGTDALAPVLSQAIVDGLTEARLAQVVLGDPSKVMGDLVVQGSLHASGERVRVRLRVLGQKGQAQWAGHVDGTLARSLDLEDEVVAIVSDAVRSRTQRDPGPADPSLREAYEKALADITSFSVPRTRQGIAALEAMEAKKAGDPRIRTLLAQGIINVWAQTGARDRGALARAEDLALRALQDEPALAQAHHIIARVRCEDGELAAGLRADEECLRHDPRNVSAHENIGSILCESLFVKEGRRRLDLAARIDPRHQGVAFSRIEMAAMVGDKEQAQALLADMAAKGGELAATVATTRLAAWWNDKALALRAADTIDAAKTGASWDVAADLMRAIASGAPSPKAPATFAMLTSPQVSPRHRTMMHEIAADYFALVEDAEGSLAHIAAASKLPFTNLLWMDGSPPLALVRGDPRFAEARATTAARVASLWGSVGSWPNE